MRTHSLLACVALFSSIARADDPVLKPSELTIKTEPAEDGWLRHVDLLADQKWGATIHAFVAHNNDLWLGTAAGRLLHLHEGKWTIEADKLPQINGIAVESDDTVWLATTNGIRRLVRKEHQWENKEDTRFHEGHPAFVSGGYIAGSNAWRLWGYVDDIFVPRSERTYAPFVISESHGLFSYSQGVWHHFLPHYWGANSPWLDTTELIPHRRPTRMIEDKEGNLWVGTRWDGLVRFNTHARAFHKRRPEDNKQDGTEVTKYGDTDIGLTGLKEVREIKPGRESGIWAVLATDDRSQLLARFDGKAWSTLPLPEPPAYQGESRFLLGVLSDNHVLVATESGTLDVTWADKQLKKTPSRNQRFTKLAVTSDGTVYGASYGKDVESIFQKRFE